MRGDGVSHTRLAVKRIKNPEGDHVSPSRALDLLHGRQPGPDKGKGAPGSPEAMAKLVAGEVEKMNGGSMRKRQGQTVNSKHEYLGVYQDSDPYRLDVESKLNGRQRFWEFFAGLA